MTEPPRIVLVEDDEPLQRLLVSALERALPDVEVQRTPDVDDALRLVCDGRSRLLITEAESAAVDGLTLAACARRQRPTLPVIFLGGANLNGSLSRMTELGDSHLVDKPPDMGRFVGLVARVLEPPTGFRGEVASSDLIELVQLVLMSMPTGALHLSAAEGRGTMWLEKGNIVHATVGHDKGVAAFHRMLRWTSGSFRMDARLVAPDKSITMNTTQLLLDSARILDEEKHRHDNSQASGARPKVLAQPTTRAVEHFERGLELVQLKQYAEALLEWERAGAIDPDNRVYQHNLKRLRHLMMNHERKLPGDGL